MSNENQEPEAKDKGENALPAWARVTKGPLPYFVTNSELYPEITAAATHDAGVAWKLMNYCAQMRNGGFIEGCQEWSTARWNKLFNFSKKPREKSVFYRWENNGLRVLCYDAEKDAQALETSQRRREAAYRRWLKYHSKKADANADANADAEKRREEKRREDEEDFSSKKSSSSSSRINRIPPSSDACPSVGATGAGTDDGKLSTSTAQQPPPPSAPPPPSDDEVSTAAGGKDELASPEDLNAFMRKVNALLDYDEEPRLSGPEAAAYLRALEAGEIKEDEPAAPTPAPEPQPETADEERRIEGEELAAALDAIFDEALKKDNPAEAPQSPPEAPDGTSTHPDTIASS